MGADGHPEAAIAKTASSGILGSRLRVEGLGHGHHGRSRRNRVDGEKKMVLSAVSKCPTFCSEDELLVTHPAQDTQ